MDQVFGIYVGNSSACLALHNNSKSSVEVLSNNAGERVTPALVTITETEDVVGTACKSLLVSRWNVTVTCNKSLLDTEDVGSLSARERSITVVEREGELQYEIPLDNRTHYTTPADIASCLYRYLYDIARCSIPGEAKLSCVLLVPCNFTEAGRFKMRLAAQEVGWNVLQIIHEPAAVVLGYNMLCGNEPPPHQKVLVYRLGGNSCDVTIIDLHCGMITILDTEHSNLVSGKMYTTSLTTYLADCFYSKYRLDPRENHRAFVKLTQAAESCVHVLSTMNSATCFVESLCEGVDLNQTVSRARLESLVVPYLQMFIRPLDTILNRLDLTPDDISTVLICGGPLNMPRLKKHITDIFNENKTKVAPLPNGVNYDEILACGAARQAGCISLGRMSSRCLPSHINISVLELAVTVQMEGAKWEKVEFEPGHPLPAHKTIDIIRLEPTVTITFIQVTLGSMLKGEIHLDKLEHSTKITLEIDNNNYIQAGVPASKEELQYHKVIMHAYPILL